MFSDLVKIIKNYKLVFKFIKTNKKNFLTIPSIIFLTKF